MKSSISLKIPNFAEDNELLMYSPYWTLPNTCVASYWRWLLHQCLTWRGSLPPSWFLSSSWFSLIRLAFIWKYFSRTWQLSHHNLRFKKFNLIWPLKASTLPSSWFVYLLRCHLALFYIYVAAHLPGFDV